MRELLSIIFLALVAWIGIRFAYYYWTATAVGTWAKIIEAAGDSATYFVAKIGMFGAALMGLITTGGEFFATTPEAKAGFHQWLATYLSNPTAIAVGGIGLMLLVWWARSRTME